MAKISVSVVIPTYNRGAAVARTVDSVLSQDLPPDEVEVIIVDDGSTDDTLAVLQQLYGDNSQVRLFSIPNGGVANARNFGLSHAEGEFIAYLDHDDFWLPSKLRLQRERMEDPQVGLVYCFWIATDESGVPAPEEVQHSQHLWWKPQRGDVYPWILVPDPQQIPRNPIYSMTFPLMRTQLVRDLKGFDVDVVPSDDWDMWIRLSLITHFDYVPEVLAHYVQHPNQQHKHLENALKSWLRLCLKHPVDHRKHPLEWRKVFGFKQFCREHLAYCHAKNSLFRGRYARVLPYFILAFSMRPDRAIQKHWGFLFLRVLQRNTNPY